jgi:hypothetical protein
VLPATKTHVPASDPRAAFRPTILVGARPALDLEQVTDVMEAFEDYVDASFIEFEGVDQPAFVYDEALDLRLASL